jgi:hypothetical protein
MSVAQYADNATAAAAFAQAVQASIDAPGGNGELISGVGDQAFIGSSGQAGETHVGGGALFGDLIVTATLQAFPATDENRARVIELLRRQGAQAQQVLSGRLLPREAVLPLSEVELVVPVITLETGTGLDDTALGTPVGSRGVTFTSENGAQRVVVSVAQYATAAAALAAYTQAVKASENAPGFEGGPISGVGEQAFLGTSGTGDEKHVGAGALFGDLIVTVTLQNFPADNDHKGRAVDLLRKEGALAQQVL